MKIIQALSDQADIIRNKSSYYKVGEDKIEIKPITVGQVIAISPHLNQIMIDEDVKSPKEFFDKLLERLDEFMQPIKEIFSELIDYDFDKLLPVDIVNLLVIVIHQMDTKSFQTSITLMKKVSRNSREIIALAEQNYLTQ